MLSVIGEEYVSYSEGTKGQFTPLIAISKYDGTISYREIVREDLLRIPDDKLAPGGWLFRKTQNTSSSWVKRFALLRGDFMFFFHSPQNEKPIAILPLQDCKIVAPDNNEKSFDDLSRNFRANETGHEFDIRHNTLPTVRLYALSEQERNEWIVACRERITACYNRQLLQGKENNKFRHVNERNTNITITNVRLSGVSLAPVAAPLSTTQQHSQLSYSHASLPPPAQQSMNSYERHQYEQQQQQQQQSHEQKGQDPYNPDVFDDNMTIASSVHLAPYHNKPPPYSSQHNTASVSDVASVSNYSLNSYQNEISVRGGAYGGPSAVSGGGHYGQGNQVPFQQQPPQYPQPPQQHTQLPRTNKLDKSKMNLNLLNLETNLQKKFTDQQEARKREEAVRQRISSRESILVAREAEERNPLTLAEIFRVCLFFIDEELVEDAQEGMNSQLQVPHLKGEAVEQMLVTVYQRYCGASGFMSLEEFVEFMEDVNILHTHVPHNDNDEPLDDYVTQLDPVRLLTLVPRNYGFVASDSTFAISEKLLKAAKTDKFIINFTQFYQLLLRITQIVYEELYESDATLAFNKLLQEAICPLFVWSKGRHKRGSTDVLVLEERILLILTLYSPNLWRVFLTFAHDAVGKVAEINQPFPDNAQNNEKGLFKLPPAAPAKHLDIKVTQDSLIMSEAGCLRFARDYGIVPAVVSTKELRDIFKRTNRQKVIISSRLPTRDQLSKPEKPVVKKNTIAPMRFTAPPDAKLQSSRSTASKPIPAVVRVNSTAAVGGAKGGKVVNDNNEDDDLPPPPPPPITALPTAAAHTGVGIGFSEFLELIARVAVDGMQQPNYHAVFPTPFSKVLAILTVWGVADLKKLEEVQIVRTDNY